MLVQLTHKKGGLPMLSIDFRDSRPIYEQVADGIETMAMHGIYQPDDQLPSVRQLAMELSINPNTIQRAYSELEIRNIVYSVKGRGSFISSDCINLRTRRIEEISKKITELSSSARELGATNEQIISWVNGKKEEKI